jgi:hypothetical protein
MDHARQLVAASLKTANGDGLSSMLRALHRRLRDSNVQAADLNLCNDLIRDMNGAFGLEVLPKDFRFWLGQVINYCSFSQSNEVSVLTEFWMRNTVHPVEEQIFFRAHLLRLPPDLKLRDTEINAIGLLNPRSLIAQLKPTTPLMSVFSLACRLSLEPQAKPDALLGALESHEGSLDPLWPALARHLARLSTEQDRALLEELAQHPERREPPLSWGLRYIVRGDVTLDDGSALTLDEVTDQMGMPRLPYLENIPPRGEATLASE